MKQHLAHLILAAMAAFTLTTKAQLIDTPKPEPTAAELAAQSVVDAVNAEILHRVAVHQICWNTIWKNERPGATPAAVLAALGTKAGLIFAFASENLDHIDRCAQIIGKTRADFIADADCIPPVAFTVSADGIVTLN
ncbi:hypothetical protein [Prosthecobacter sp.]|uniref:hypothetical protein n=1 Tax=Prosthecobacter sp. TaxID=1965333 RepID=UPI0037849E32